MEYYKSKGNRLYLNDNIFIDTDDNQIMPNFVETDKRFYIPCSKGEFLKVYSDTIKKLDKLAGL